MYSWFFGKYFYEDELFNLIDIINNRRKQRRLKGLTMRSSFAEDLKDLIKGINIIEEEKEEIKKSSSDSSILYDNKRDENIKMYIENQFKNS